MNFLQLKTLTASWLDDLQYGYFTESQVETWLNNAAYRVQGRLLKAKKNFYNKPVQTTLVINQADYVLPDDFRKMISLEVVVSGTVPNESLSPISEITTNQKFLVGTGTGTPQLFRFKANRIVVLPAPDQALVMRMEYAYQVARMVNATDIPDVPERYHELLAILACEDGFLKDGRTPDLIEKKKKDFETEFDSDANDRNEAAPRSVVSTGSSGDYTFGGW